MKTTTQIEIDCEATKHNMRMIRLSVYSRERGIPEQTLRKVISGTYGPSRGEKYYRVVEILRDDGFLVEKKAA